MAKQRRSATRSARSIEQPSRRLDLLWAPVDAASLAVFRIAFGALHDPELLRQLSVALRDALEERTGLRYQILVDARLSLNARPPKPLVDPAIDLASQPASLLPKPWIVPLPESRGAKVPS